MADLTKLIARVEALTEANRSADLEIHMAVCPELYDTDNWLWDDDTLPPPLTASLDAATALTERLGFVWLKKSVDVMTVLRPLTPEQDERKEWAVHYDAKGPTPAIALILATLKAKQAQEKTDE